MRRSSGSPRPQRTTRSSGLMTCEARRLTRMTPWQSAWRSALGTCRTCHGWGVASAVSWSAVWRVVEVAPQWRVMCISAAQPRTNPNHANPGTAPVRRGRRRRASSDAAPRKDGAGRAVRYNPTTTTSWEYSARARKSPESDVSTEPPGSATATTNASTADPRRASERRRAARLATRSPIPSRTSQVLSSRFVGASLAGSPCKHSMSTGDGTTGGQSPFRRNSSIKATARLVRAARKETAPESRTSANQLAIRSARPTSRLTNSCAQAVSAGSSVPTSASNSVR